MSNVPEELMYTKSHEWIQVLEDGSVNIGITDHAQELLGDLVFVELPDIDRDLNAGEECAVVESVKAASDIYSPVTGKVIAVNDQLNDTPEIINQDAYGDGWILRVQISDKSELDALIDAAGYKGVAESEEY